MNQLLPKLFVVGGGVSYASYLRPQEGRSVQFEITHDPKEADVALFTGGEDVNPKYYNQPCGSRTCFSDRDRYEKEAFEFFASEEIPMIGICRGLQFFAAMNGGGLIQHTTGHAGGTHNVVFDYHEDPKDKTKALVLPYTSAHHQMVDPTKVKPNWKILGRSEERRSKCYLNGKDEEIHGVDTEIECVFFPDTLCLGIQGHPEWMDPESPSVEHWRQLIKEHIL